MVVLFLLIFSWLLGVICCLSKHRLFGGLFHKIGWCYPDENIIDENICKFCGNHITQDSQGNWY